MSAQREESPAYEGGPEHSAKRAATERRSMSAQREESPAYERSGGR